jgi:formylglycine-generating enzyme required for sulfatase activity
MNLLTGAILNNISSKNMIAELVLIPGGEFLMGSNSEGDHSPAHSVHIDSFYMDKYEVTNAQYLAFCQATGHRLPEFWGMSGFRCGPDYRSRMGIRGQGRSGRHEFSQRRHAPAIRWELQPLGSGRPGCGRQLPPKWLRSPRYARQCRRVGLGLLRSRLLLVQSSNKPARP